MRILRAAVVLASLLPNFAHAQTDWDALRALPREANVEVRELGGKGYTGGKLVLVEDEQLTLIQARRAIVVPKALVGRVDYRRRDPVWEGLIIGLIWGIVARATYAGEACYETPEPMCTLLGLATTSGLGAFVDWRIRGRETIYRTPKRRAIPLASIRF